MTIVMSREIFLAVGLVVLVASLLALLIKSALFALVLDQWMDLRSLPATSPERYVARYDLWSSVLRIVGVLLVLTLGVTWVVAAATLPLMVVILTPLTIIVAATAIGHAILADIQGIRSLIFRRHIIQLVQNGRHNDNRGTSDFGVASDERPVPKDQQARH